MTDKNGIEIKTGDIVEITGAFFKNDNGIYFVQNSPGDPTWSGSDHSLARISKKGKISTAKHNLCFWPIGTFVSDRQKAAKAHRWNKEHAQIEVKAIENMEEVSTFFQTEADRMEEVIRRTKYDFGENSDIVKKYEAMQAHYRAVAEYTRRSQNEQQV